MSVYQSYLVIKNGIKSLFGLHVKCAMKTLTKQNTRIRIEDRQTEPKTNAYLNIFIYSHRDDKKSCQSAFPGILRFQRKELTIGVYRSAAFADNLITYYHDKLPVDSDMNGSFRHSACLDRLGYLD